MENQKSQAPTQTPGAAPDAKSEPAFSQPGQSIVINTTAAKPATNSLGVTGFVLAVIGVFLSWLPLIGWLIWLLGAIFSVIGLFKQPRELAIAGTVLSFIDLIVLVVVIGSLASLV